MKSIISYINEKLILNKQSKITIQSKININIDKTTNFTSDEINTIIDFFNNCDIKPYDISNLLYVDSNSRYENTIYVHYKSIYGDDSVIQIMKNEDNEDNEFVVLLNWPTFDGADSFIGGADHYQYPSRGTANLDELIDKCLSKALKNKKFVSSLKK